MIEISTHTCGTKQSVEQAFMYKYNKSCDCPGYNRERGAFPLWRDNIYGHDPKAFGFSPWYWSINLQVLATFLPCETSLLKIGVTL